MMLCTCDLARRVQPWSSRSRALFQSVWAEAVPACFRHHVHHGECYASHSRLGHYSGVRLGVTVCWPVGEGLSSGGHLIQRGSSRFLGGVGVGMVTALVPSYTSECTPRAIRGRCTGLIQLAN